MLAVSNPNVNDVGGIKKIGVKSQILKFGVWAFFEGNMTKIDFKNQKVFITFPVSDIQWLLS